MGHYAQSGLVDYVYRDIAQIAIYNSSNPTKYIRKKALLCLLRIFRKHKDRFINLEAWAKPLNRLLDDKNLGVLMSTMALLLGLVKLSNPKKFQVCIGKVIDLLRRIHG